MKEVSLDVMVAELGRVFDGDVEIGSDLLARSFTVLEVPGKGDLLLRKVGGESDVEPGTEMQLRWEIAADNNTVDHTNRFFGLGRANLYLEDGKPYNERSRLPVTILPAPSYINAQSSTIYDQEAMPRIVYEQRFNHYDRRLKMPASTYVGRIAQSTYPIAPPWHSLGDHDVRQAMYVFQHGPTLWNVVRGAVRTRALKEVGSDCRDMDLASLESSLHRSQKVTTLAGLIDEVIDTQVAPPDVVPGATRKLLRAAGVRRSRRDDYVEAFRREHMNDLLLRIGDY